MEDLTTDLLSALAAWPTGGALPAGRWGHTLWLTGGPGGDAW